MTFACLGSIKTMNKGNTLQKAVIVLAFCMTLFVPLRDVLACTIGHEVAVGDYDDNACHELPASLAGDCQTADHNQCIQHCAATSSLEVAIKGQKTSFLKATDFSPKPFATPPSSLSFSGLPLASQANASFTNFEPLFGPSTILLTRRFRL